MGDGKGVAVQMKRNKNTRPSTAVSDLAEAAVMGEKSVSLISKGLGGEVWRRGILPGPRLPRDGLGALELLPIQARCLASQESQMP